ncbi:hypothetical protein LMG31506_03686 [Cupriavidus yeoncheonensis]|uniref:Uncharacterized protein n=1 Tax=Cupriavidus yeoncheonensis TaxID=1462994 RepID=A0A916IVY2_9BURK|nr:hypothetical protein LMG31506_03686 [Cupriavidus yeoncheonensis]
MSGLIVRADCAVYRGRQSHRNGQPAVAAAGGRHAGSRFGRHAPRRARLASQGRSPMAGECRRR